MSDFCSEDFAHTARLLRSGNDKLADATCSNNRNIILAALDLAARTGIGRLRFMRRVMDQGFIKLSIEQVDELLADFAALERGPTPARDAESKDA